MSNYYFRRASDLKTDQLVDIVMDIDNGHYDETVDEKIKKDLTYLLERNSLERHYILYYILLIKI